jgi:A-kinase anchor protein 10
MLHFQVDVLTSSPVSMSDVLYNDTLLFHFMEFLEVEGDRDLIEFWITASNYR